MELTARHLATLIIALAGGLASDSADAAYTYEVQVHYTHSNGSAGYWAERETFDTQAEAMDAYYFLLYLKVTGDLDEVYPSGRRAYAADGVRLVRFLDDVSDPWGEQWIHLHYVRYWESLAPNGDESASHYGYYYSY